MSNHKQTRPYQRPEVLWAQQFYSCNILSNASLATSFDDVEDGGEMEMEP